MKRFLSLLMAAMLLLSTFAFAEETAPTYYWPGDTMDDFTVTMSDGKEMTLSEILKTKELVILNFWATWCGPCRSEFPYMEEAYLKHQDKVEIIALSVESTDTNDVIEAFKAENGLTALPMGQDTTGLSDKFYFTGIPTSVAIDRFGVICWQESGSITSTDKFERLFSGFLGEDYTESDTDYAIPGPKPTAANVDDATLTAALNAEGSAIPVANAADPMVWPFLPTEGDALKSSNAGVDETTAAVYATVTANAGDVLSFEYVMSSEAGMDYLMLEVDGKMIEIFSGEETGVYAYAFETEGEHAVTLAYVKDTAALGGEDYALIDNLQVLTGDAAAAALAALPVYPRVLEGTEYQVLPMSGKQAFVTEPTGVYALQMGGYPIYVAGADEITFEIQIGKDLNPKMALVYEDCTGGACTLSDLTQTANGYTVTVPVSSVEAGGYSSTYVYLYPNYMMDPNTAMVIFVFANEENMNLYVKEELPAYYGLTDATWAYADGAAPATDKIAKAPSEQEIPEGMAQYTVYFVDQNGAPVANVMAQVCDAETCEVLPSDENGMVSFVKAQYAYEIHVLMAPEGYTFNTEATAVLAAEGDTIIIEGVKN